MFSAIFVGASFFVRSLSLFTSFFSWLFLCEFRKKEIWGGIDLQRTRADQVCLTKSSECFRSVVSRYHQISFRQRIAKQYCDHKTLDSEWHSFFSCPACENPRHIFCKAFPRFYDLFFPQHDPLQEAAGPTQDQITSLANIIYEARFSRNLTNELARFVSGIHACRQREFSSLLKNSPLSPLGAALRQGVLVN